MSITHNLKIEENYLRNLKAEKKKAEIRFNDRDFQSGDILKFYDTLENKYISFEITHIHSGLGLERGYVCLSLMFKEGE